VKKLDSNWTRTDEVREGREKKVFAECRRSVANGTARDSKVVHNDAHGDMIVEVAATLGVNGPQPYAVGEIGTFYKDLIENQHAFEKLIVEAYMEGSYTKALQALTLNRTVVDAKKARVVLDALIEANKDYWPTLNK